MVIGFITWGCSSDDDGGTERVAGGSDARPTWQVPNYDHYEQIMGDQWKFPLIIASNDAGVNIQLSYYSEALHRIFTINWTTFDTSVAPTGTGGIYEPSFVHVE